MDKKRFIWYKNEIARLRALDMQTADKVRASYTIEKPKKKKKNA